MDIRLLISKIDTNNDQLITKGEIEEYQKKNSLPSIFTNYFKSITKEVKATEFSKNLEILNKKYEEQQQQQANNTQKPEQSENTLTYFKYNDKNVKKKESSQ